MPHSPEEYERGVAAATALANTIARAEGYADPRTAFGQCLIASDRLIETLNGVQTWCIRVIGVNYPGREHWAVVLPRWEHADSDEPDVAAMTGTVVDMTCRQFSADAPSVFVGSVDDWLDDACEWLADGVMVEVYPRWRESDPDHGVVWMDVHHRDDIEPADLVYPWERQPA